MRGALIRGLIELAERDDRVMLLTGDLGYTVIEPFAERFPTQFMNMGVAEQNMIGVATGLAEAGFVPFAYSIATFAALRPFEFIRNGPVLHDLPVRIVGVGGGFEYGQAGPSHHAIEDVAVMRALPGLTILAPADHEQATAVVRATRTIKGPVYLRLGKDDRAVVPGLRGRFRLGRAEVVREGADVLFVAMGAAAVQAAAAADLLAAEGVAAGLVVVASVAPSPLEDLANQLAHVAVVISVEDHSVAGGLGSLVAELIAEGGLHARLVRAGVRDRLAGRTGSEAWLRARHGLSRDSLAARARVALADA